MNRERSPKNGFGRALREARKRRGLSQRAFADLVGVNFRQVSAWEVAPRQSPTRKQYELVVAALPELAEYTRPRFWKPKRKTRLPGTVSSSRDLEAREPAPEGFIEQARRAPETIVISGRFERSVNAVLQRLAVVKCALKIAKAGMSGSVIEAFTRARDELGGPEVAPVSDVEQIVYEALGLAEEAIRRD